jgi:hypothetical protein
MLRRTLLAAAVLAGVTPAAAGDPFDLEAAKKEGKIVWYTSTPIETAQRIATCSRSAPASRSSFSARAARPSCGAFCRRRRPDASPPTC